MQPKHLNSPNSTLEWVQSDTPVPGYKPAIKYPGWHWRKKEGEPVAPPAPVKIEPTPLPALPYPVKFYAEEAEIMHAELASANGVMIDKEKCIRLTDNPWWYREGYKEGYTSKKTFLSTLRQIAQGKIDTSKKYADKAIRLIEKRLEELAQAFPEFASQLHGNHAELTPTSGD